MASTGEAFQQLQVSGTISITMQGRDCCGAQLSGGVLFSGASISRVPPGPFGGSGWNIQKQQICPFLSLGEVIGSASSTTGHCSYLAACCNYTGCPPVERFVTESRLPLWWCQDTLTLVPQDVCAGVICACDEGGIPCGGNCPPAVFDEYPTADESEILFALQNVWLTVCGIGGVETGVGWGRSILQVDILPIDVRDYRSCEGCGGGLPNYVQFPYTLYYEKVCQFPGDSVKGIYRWLDLWNNGPPTQVRTVSSECDDYISPGGTRKFTTTVVGSPVMLVT